MEDRGMIKYIEQSGYRKEGEVAVRRLFINDNIKIAQYEDLPAEIRNYIDNIKPKKGFGYLLISALSDENWGDNSNADLFPTESLNHYNDEWGYKTYPKFGHWYRLHENKDPKKSFGKVNAGFWNPQMHRIEVIVEYDISIDDWTRKALAEGKDIEVSMGLKINYDVCPVCHPNWRLFYKIPEKEMIKISKSRDMDEIRAIGTKYGVDLSYITKINDNGGARGISRNSTTYCEHIKYDKKKIMPNGQKVYMVNLRPVFFDISFVRVHADKASYVLAKVANDGDILKVNPNNIDDYLDKSASDNADKSAAKKNSAMEKRVESQVLSNDDQEIRNYLTNNILPILREKEEEIPRDKLNDIAEHHSMEEILSSFLGLGMFPKKREFQRIVLVQKGMKNDADRFEDSGMIINDDMIGQMEGKMPSDMRIDVSPNNINYDLVDKLIGYADKKSYFSKPVCKRITIIKIGEEINTQLDPGMKPSSPIPTMLLAAAGYYAIAKKSGLETDSLIKAIAKNRLKLIAGLIGAGLAYNIINSAKGEWQANKDFIEKGKSAMDKEGKNPLASMWVIPAITIPSYIAAEHYRGKAMRGEHINVAQRELAKHPGAASIAGIALANPTTRKYLGGLAKAIFKGGYEIVKEGMGFEGLDIDLYPPEEHEKIVVGMWDAVAERELK